MGFEVTDLTYHGQIATMAIYLEWLALVALIVFTLALDFCFRRLRRASRYMIQFCAGHQGSDTNLLPNRPAERMDPQSTAILEALFQERSQLGPFSKLVNMTQAIDILAARLLRISRTMRLLGWTTLLISFVGTQTDIWKAFRGLSALGSNGYQAWASTIADAIPVQLYGAILCLLYLFISEIYELRINALRQSVVANRERSVLVQKSSGR